MPRAGLGECQAAPETMAGIDNALGSVIESDGAMVGIYLAETALAMTPR